MHCEGTPGKNHDPCPQDQGLSHASWVEFAGRARAWSDSGGWCARCGQRRLAARMGTRHEVDKRMLAHSSMVRACAGGTVVA